MVWVVGGEVQCSICKATVFTKQEQYVLLPHVISDANDPLYPFADTIMHAACFGGWAKRDDFRLAYNQNQRRAGREMLDDGTVVSRPA